MVQQKLHPTRSPREFFRHGKDVAEDNTVTGYPSKNIAFVKQAPAWSEKSSQSGSQTTESRDQGENMSKDISSYGGSTSISFSDRRERMADSVEDDSSILDSEISSVVLSEILGYKSAPTHVVLKRSVEESPRYDADKSSPRRDVDNSSFQLVEERKWTELIESIEENHMKAYAAKSGGSSIMSNGSRGNLLLHEVCKNEPPIDVVDALLKANGEAAEAKGQWGYLPLHYACSSGASPAVVEKLLRVFPKSAKTRDCNDLMTPLHLACKWGADEGILASLLNLHPEGMLVRDIYGKLPIDYANNIRSQQDRDTAVACLRRASMLGESARAQRTKIELEYKAVELRLKQQLAEENTKREELENVIDDQENDYRHLLSLCDQQLEKEKSLEEKIEVLERSEKKKQNIIENLRHALQDRLEVLEESHSLREEDLEAIFNRELATALSDQEFAHQTMREATQQKIEGLEAKVREVTLGSEDRTKYKHLFDCEQTKVKLLEEERADERQLQELENAVRKEISGLCSTKEQEYEIEWKKNQAQYESMLDIEKNRVAHLETLYFDANLLLASEQKKVNSLERCTDQMREILEAEQERAQCLEASHLESTKNLEIEQDNVRNLRESETKAKTLIESVMDAFDNPELNQKQYWQLVDAHQLLKGGHSDIRNLERALAETQARYEAEKKKFKALQQSQWKRSSILDSLQKKISMVAEVHSETLQVLENERENLKSAEESLVETEDLLESERQKVEELTLSQAELSNLLEEKMRSVGSLQEILEAHVTKIMELELFRRDMQGLLEKEQDKVKDLKEEQAYMQADRLKEIHGASLEADLLLEDSKFTLRQLEKKCVQKEELVLSEKRKVQQFEIIFKEKDTLINLEKKKAKENEFDYSKMNSLLNAESRKVRELEKAASRLEADLKSEQRTVIALEQTQARKQVLPESEQNKVKALEPAQDQKQGLVEWKQKKAQNLEESRAKIETKLNDAPTCLHSLREQDAERQILPTKLETKASMILEGARDEVAILSCQAKKQDLMLSPVLKTLDSDEPQKLQNEYPIDGAEAPLSMHTRNIGTDLFGSLPKEEHTARGALARPTFERLGHEEPILISILLSSLQTHAEPVSLRGMFNCASGN